MNSEEFRETFLRNDREGPTKAEKAERMADNNAGDRNSRRGNMQPRTATAREANPAGSVRSAGGEGNNAPREAKRKAGPSGQKEKQRKETENPEGIRNAPEAGGQNMAHEEQPQGRQEQGPEEGACGGSGFYKISTIRYNSHDGSISLDRACRQPSFRLVPTFH